MDTIERVMRAMQRHRALHTVVLVYRCIVEQGLTNGVIAGATGLQHRTVLRCLAVLQTLGLVVPLRPKATGGYEAIVVPEPPAELIEDLERASSVEVKWNLPVEILVTLEGGVKKADHMGVLTKNSTRAHGCAHESYDSSTVEGVLVLARNLPFKYIENTTVTNTLGNVKKDVLNVKKHTQLSLLDEDFSAPSVPEREESSESIDQRAQAVWAELSSPIKDAIRASLLAELDAAGRLKKPSKRPTPTQAQEESIRRLYDLWRALLGHPNATLTAARHRLLFNRLREGYTEAQLEAVIRWAATDPWIRGTATQSTRAFEDLQYYLGSADKVDRNLGQASRNSGGRNSASLMARPDEPITGRWL